MNIENALAYVKENYDTLRVIVNDEYLYEQEFCDIIAESNINYDWIGCGASKGVICPYHKEDYVIKIPFNYDDYNDVTYDVDYCKLEYTNYTKAKELGLEEFFAEIQPLIDIDGVTIYIQQKVSNGLYGRKYRGEEANNIVSNTYGPLSSECPITIIPLLIDNYGAEKTMDFLIFIEDNDINDIREANLGCSFVDNKVKLLDYSGFHEVEL